MERILKIKTKTNRVPRSTYPSERRYSASMVIGLSVVFLQLFFYSVLMGTLIVHKMTVQPLPKTTNDTGLEENDTIFNVTNSTAVPLQLLRLYEKVDKDLDTVLRQTKDLMERNSEMEINIPILMCSGCFLMAVGYLLAFGMGMLAWKQWYIDHNISFFFFASSLSFLTSAIGLLFSLMTCVNLDYDYDSYTYEMMSRASPITFSLAVNITILSLIGVIWSVLSTKIAFVGMRSGYPDDMVFNKGGRHVEVSTEQKGSKKCAPFPQHIIESFPRGHNKLAKYLPKKENGNLPKPESTLEFQQRVHSFLAEVPENSAKNG